MKKGLSIILGATVILAGCTKKEGLTGPADTSMAYMSFTNANANGKTVDFFVDNTKLNQAASIAPNGTVTGTYVGVYPGERLLEVKESSTTATYYHNSNITTLGGKSYSYIIYDTIKQGRFKGILLTSERKIDPGNGNCKVRFLNLSPKAPMVDLWFVRRVGAVAKDSIKLYSAVQSLSSVASPDATALSAYIDLAANQAAGAAGAGVPVSDYIIRAKLTGTNTILTSTAATTLVNGRTYTFFLRGIFPGVGLTSFLNN